MSIQTISDNAKYVVISMNPGSGASHPGDVVEQLQTCLCELGYTVEVETDFSVVQSRVANLMATGELRAVVAAGGDGTVSLLANGLSPEVTIAILPLGTENLLAKYLGIARDPVLLAKLIDEGNYVRLDAGRANGKLFLVMASSGFDADVVKRMHSSRRGNIRHWSYAGPIFQTISSYRYPDIKIWVDDEPKPVIGKWAFIFNVPRYAMNLSIVEQADSMDGLLDLCVLRGGSLFRGLFHLFEVVTGRHRKKTGRFRRFRRLRIESEDTVAYQLDGDPGGELPLEIQVEPERLGFVVDQNWASHS